MYVDELRIALGRARRQDLAATAQTMRPVREPPGGVVRPGDQTGPHLGRPAREPLLDRTLAERLEAAIVLRHVFARRILELDHRRRLVQPGSVGGA